MYSIEFEKKCEDAATRAVSEARAAAVLAEFCEDAAPTLYGIAEGRRTSKDFHVALKMAVLQCALESAKKALGIEVDVNRHAERLIDSMGDLLAKNAPMVSPESCEPNPKVEEFVNYILRMSV